MLQPSRPDVAAWRELYLAALFEVDPAKMSARIIDAEKAIILRARELFQMSGDNIEEESALDDALYALRALRTSCARGAAAAASFVA